MKKLFLSVAEFAGLKIDKAAVEANDQMVVSEEQFAQINSALEEAKGFKTKFEASEKELEELRTAKADAETKISDLTATNTSLVEEKNKLKTQVEELGAKSGSTKTEIKTEEEDKKEMGLPSYCNASLGIYQMLEETQD